MTNNLIYLFQIDDCWFNNRTIYKERAYEVKKFLYESGLYYEKLGELYQAESSWKLVININILAR